MDPRPRARAARSPSSPTGCASTAASTRRTTPRCTTGRCDDLDGVLVGGRRVPRRPVPRRSRRRCSARATMPGAEWFPGATLNYAEHALTAGPGRADDDVARASSPARTACERDGHARRAARRGRPGAGRAGASSASAAATGWSRWRPNSRRDAGHVPRRGEPRRDLVVLLAGLRRPRGARPVRPDRADGPARRRRLRLRRQAVRHPRHGASTLRGAAADAARHRARPLPGRGRHPRRHACRGRSSPATPGAAGVRAGAVRPPAVGALLVGHHRACPRASCTATAASCWST